MKGEIAFYWRLLLRRLPAMALLFLVASAIGLALAVRLPAVYSAQARLLVEAPRISEELAQSTVQISATEEIEIIRQQLLTRANLIDIARDRGVFAEIGMMRPDDIVEEMRTATRISDRGGGRGGPTIVDVSFEARSGAIAADVVNEYVTRITAANVQNRADVAGDTLNFFEQEVERLDRELRARQEAISAFQRENVGALPDGQAYRQGRQSLLQERLAGIARDISNLEEQQRRLTDLFESTGQVAPLREEGTPRSPAEARVAEIEAAIQEALLVYSENNPRVVQLRARLDLAREALAGEAAPPGTAAAAENPQAMIYEFQMTELDTRIEQLRAQIPPVEEELEELRMRIEQTPLNGITLSGMQRDYENYRSQLDAAIARRNAASMGERIELSARGRRISLVEAASIPASPTSPNRPLVAAAGAGIGLALAAGLFVLLELLNSTPRRPADITAKLGIVPLATIPYLETRRRRLWRRAGRIALMLAVLIGVPAGLWAVDSYYLPLDLLTQRVLDRLGLA
ncbi:GumC family protein [Jannaschia formosa]|uniref:GumC family protein n=1 Tax=Jannaschia formosa TaxID=2259592 RepID=UPI000E1BE14F|nr:lipopolysaccharide biosynthesis [Jannaschia formosa]TFL17123.1 lipopolysaccharide biosynthesis [Jannaschia formosa]